MENIDIIKLQYPIGQFEYPGQVSVEELRDLQNCSTYGTKLAAQTSLNSFKRYENLMHHLKRWGIPDYNQFKIVPVKLTL